MPTLNALLQTADFVTLHVPLAPDTKNMIGAEQIKQMKPGSYLLNASRGNVVVRQKKKKEKKRKTILTSLFPLLGY